MSFILALFPLAVFLYVLLFRRRSLLAASCITCAVAIVLMVVYWKMLPVYILVALLKGTLIASDIFIIIFGAIFFLHIVQQTRIIQSLGSYMESFTKDYRIQIILLAWFLENFLEGTAGFGTPSTIVAPMLMNIGIAPLGAVVLSLLGNSASVVFGAAGAPIRIGLAGLATASTPFHAALINIAGFIVPTFMLWIATQGQQNRKRDFIEALPFAVWSGLLFVIPSVLIARIFGQELPSILGSVIGFVGIFVSMKLRFLMPRTIRSLHDYSPYADRVPLKAVVFPYALLILFLIAGKFILGSLAIQISLPENISHAITIFNPGLAFICVGLLTLIMHKKTRMLALPSASIAFMKSLEPFFIIVAMSFFVQMTIFSGHNTSGLPASISLIAQVFENSLLPALAPFIGAFGSFLTGSATLSNIMFAPSLAMTAQKLFLNTDLILALALVGGAAGNMIALADMIAAETVAGLKNKEREVLAGVIVPCIIYLSLTAAIGLVALRLLRV